VTESTKGPKQDSQNLFHSRFTISVNINKSQNGRNQTFILSVARQLLTKSHKENIRLLLPNAFKLFGFPIFDIDRT
jgi:hypothetical protein